MTPQSALADGDLSSALTTQTAIVADDDNDAAARLFLVELLAVAGQYAEAWRHLNAITAQDEKWPKSRRHFKRLLKLLSQRRRGLRPQFLANPPRHARYRRRLRRAVHKEETQDTLALLDRADDSSPYIIGHIDGREIDGLRDADDRTASVLEAFLDGEYVWLPFEAMDRIRVAAAVNVLDRAVRPAVIRFVDGEEIAAMLPLTYPAFYELPEEDVLALGLDTDRCEEHGGVTTARGGKLFLTEAEEVYLGEVRQIDIRQA